MNDSPVSGSLGMIQPAWHQVSGSEAYQDGVLYQTSLMSALIAGLYEGEMTTARFASTAISVWALSMTSMVRWSALTGLSISSARMGPLVRRGRPEDAVRSGYLFPSGARAGSATADGEKGSAGDD